MASNAKSGEIEANPAPKYEDHDGPQRVGADLGTAYPVDGPPPKESVTSDEPGSEQVTKKVGQPAKAAKGKELKGQPKSAPLAGQR